MAVQEERAIPGAGMLRDTAKKIPQPKLSSTVGMHINTNKSRRASGMEVSWQKAALSSHCCWNKGSWKVGVTANTARRNYGEQRNRYPLCAL